MHARRHGWTLTGLLGALLVVLAGCGSEDITSLPESRARLLFSEDFEDGNFNGWTLGAGAYTRSVVSPGANGTGYALTQAGGATAHHDGLRLSLGAGIQPTYVRFFVRSANAAASDAYFVMGDSAIASASGEVLFVYLWSTGQIRFVNDSEPDILVPYLPNTWYLVELKNINWAAKTLDVWVNGAPQRNAFAFRGAGVAAITDLSLYNFENSQAWWDEILMID